MYVHCNVGVCGAYYVFFLSCSSDNLTIENHLELESVHSTADNIYYMRVFSRSPHVCVLFYTQFCECVRAS